MPTANAALATYLDDHLAGAASALTLLEQLASAYADTEIAAFADRLHGEVSADRVELQRIAATLGIAESAPRNAAAWIGEKLVQWKTRFDDPAKRGLHLLELLEALSLGIEGKRQLWLALTATAEASPTFRLADYNRLRQRAEQQRAEVEAHRLAAARAALRLA